MNLSPLGWFILNQQGGSVPPPPAEDLLDNDNEILLDNDNETLIG